MIPSTRTAPVPARLRKRQRSDRDDPCRPAECEIANMLLLERGVIVALDSAVTPHIMTEPLNRTSATEPAGGYDPDAIERKWQERWEARGTNDTDIDGGMRPFYALMMFPYPSA